MTETAISSVNIIRIKAKAKKGDKSAKRVYKLSKKYSETLTTILVFNNIVNILSTSLATYIFSKCLGSSGVVYATTTFEIAENAIMNLEGNSTIGVNAVAGKGEIHIGTNSTLWVGITNFNNYSGGVKYTGHQILALASVNAGI